jgi:putative membrane protein
LLAPSSSIAIAVVAAAHVGFFLLESFLFNSAAGRRIFGHSEAHAALLAPLMFNQGWYNAFLAAGLVWSLIHPVPEQARALATFFLTCVLLAGLVGGLSVKRVILVIQGLPALVALALVWAQ